MIPMCLNLISGRSNHNDSYVFEFNPLEVQFNILEVLAAWFPRG